MPYTHQSPPASLAILVVDDESVIRGPVALCLETAGYQVAEAATPEEAVAAASQRHLDIALVDIRLGTASGLDLIARLLALEPRLKIIVITAYGSIDIAMRAVARGACDFLCKPFTPDQIIAAVARAAALRSLESSVGLMPDRSGTAGPEADFATTSAPLQDAVLAARRAAPSDAPFLLLGEPGTGKSVLARAIHSWSRRPEGPFLRLDCAAHSATFIELALFGDALAGDQSIAADQPSLLHRAAGGTLLITHAQTLAPRSQERLARVIETRSIESNTSAPPTPADVRLLITAASPDTSIFHPSLRTQLDRFSVTLPPLRSRADDIPLLAQRYLAFARQNSNKALLGFAVDALDRLLAYSWPGNLRELRSVVTDAAATTDTSYIHARHLPASLRESPQPPRSRPRAGDPVTLRDLEVAHLREILASAPSLQTAADTLGIDLQALYRRRKQYNLE